MITITNITPPHSSGIPEYALAVNGEEITRFNHLPKNGLDVCLLTAATAYHKKQLEAARKKLEEIKELQAKYDELKFRMDGLEK